MTGVVVVMAVVLFLAGLLVGVVAAGSMLLRREDSAHALADRLGTYARRVNGLGR